MSYTLLRGSFVTRYADLPRQGPQPDGDTVKFLPDTPGMEELRLPQAGFDGFYAVAAPAGTPAAVVQRLTREVSEIMALPEVKEKCAQLAMEAVAVGPDALRAIMKTDIARFRELGQRIKISLD